MISYPNMMSVAVIYITVELAYKVPVRESKKGTY